MNNSLSIQILELVRNFDKNEEYQAKITRAIDEVRSLYLAKEVLEKQIEVYKLFAPPKKPVDIWRIGKNEQEVIKDFIAY